jgi:hypothetical protein
MSKMGILNQSEVSLYGSIEGASFQHVSSNSSIYALRIASVRNSSGILILERCLIIDRCIDPLR